MPGEKVFKRKEVMDRLVPEIANLYPLQGEWNETDYFSLPDTNWIVELTDGELIMAPPPSDTHQRVLANLFAAMRAHVRANRLGTLRFAPLAVRLWPGKIREPDILYVSSAHADRVGEDVYGPPDLVVEILSPNTQSVDREDKFQEYAQAGVQEYWLVDPKAETVEVYDLDLRRKKYRLQAKARRGERAASQALNGFEIQVDVIFAE